MAAILVPASRVGSKCSVCQKTSFKYETLACDHRFCEICINHQISRLSSVKDFETVTIVCPYCRDYFFSKLAFLKVKNKKPQKNVGFATPRRDPSFSAEAAKRCEPCAAMREYATSSFWCHNCAEYLCSTCAYYHQRMKMSREHVVKTVRDKERYGDIRSKVSDVINTPPAVRKSSQVTARREVSKLRCEPCGETRKAVEAKYCCQTCNERLCDNCAKCHRSMKMSRSHKLANLKESKPKPKPVETRGDWDCERHYGEQLSLYCRRCRVPCCSICAITVHSNCGGATKLPPPGTARDDKTKSDTGQKPKDAAVPKSITTKPSTLTKTEDTIKAVKPTESKPKIPKNRMENRKSRLACAEDVPGNWVISMALLASGDLLLTELLQTSLKLVDSTGTLLDVVQLHGDPWSVAVQDDKLAAVTFSDRKQVQLVSISPYEGMKALRRFGTRHKSMAVTFAKDLIITSCWDEGCIHVLNNKGMELCSVDKDTYGDKLFTSPEYITTNKLGTIIYVSDYKRNTLTALKLMPNKLDNKPEFVFKHKDLRGPKGVSVERNGIIYVSGMVSRNIFRLSPSGELIQIYRRPEDRDYYEALSVTSAGDKLFVSAYEDNTIIVMRMNK